MIVPEPQRSTWLAVVIVCAGFLLCYTATAVFGSRSVSTTWYVLFVLVAAARFRYAGALVAAGIAALLSGPMRPAVDAVSDQQPAVWIGRGLVFALVGVVTAGLDRPDRLGSRTRTRTRGAGAGLRGAAGRGDRDRLA